MNALFENEKKDENCRNVLKHRTLCEAWLYFNLLIFMKEFKGKLSEYNAPFLQDLDLELRRLNSDYYAHFKNKWMNHSKNCKHPKCSVALNIDGNHKFTRLTCLYKNNLKVSKEFDGEAFHSCPETPIPTKFCT